MQKRTRKRNNLPRTNIRFPNAFSIWELVIVVVIIGLIAVLALPRSSGIAQTQLQAATDMMRTDLHTIRTLAKTVPPGQVLAIIMHYPHAPVTDAGHPDMWDALVCAGDYTRPFSNSFPPTLTTVPMMSASIFVSALPPEEGACCQDNGTCSEELEQNCKDVSQTFHGEGTYCIPDPCLPRGACCNTNYDCEDGVLEDDCTSKDDYRFWSPFACGLHGTCPPAEPPDQGDLPDSLPDLGYDGTHEDSHPPSLSYRLSSPLN